MKLYFTIQLVLSSLMFFGQENYSDSLLMSYKRGISLVEHLKQNNLAEIETFYKNSEDYEKLVELFKTTNTNQITLISDYYFSPELNEFIFTIYAIKYTNGNTFYQIIIELLIKGKIEEQRIVKTKSEKNDWWNKLMLTYGEEEYLRDYLQENYMIKSPPPPPPETVEVFEMINE